MPIINTNVASTTTITQNGTYDVTPYTSAIVNTPAAPTYYVEKRDIDVYTGGYSTDMTKVVDLTGITRIGQYGLACVYAHGYYGDQIYPYGCPPNYPDFSNITGVGERGLYYAFYRCRTTTGHVSFSSLTSLSGGNQGYELQYAFQDSGITSFSADNLTNVYSDGVFQYAFYNSGLESVSFDKLESASGGNCFASAFSNCSKLTSINFKSLRVASYGGCLSTAFQNDTALTSASFESFTLVNYNNSGFTNTFKSCTSLANVYFPAIKTTTFGTYKSAIQSMLQGVTGCTVHFPKNLDPQTGNTTISSLSGYPNFGGTSTVLVFDQPSTNILTGADTIEYERSPRYDTSSVLAWRVKGSNVNTTTYYTSGLTDPVIGTTIYSDAACTTAVTTVSSIA